MKDASNSAVKKIKKLKKNASKPKRFKKQKEGDPNYQAMRSRTILHINIKEKLN